MRHEHPATTPGHVDVDAGGAGRTVTATLLGRDDLPVREKSVYLAYTDAAGTALSARTEITDLRGNADLPVADRPTGAPGVTGWFGSPSTPLPGGDTADLSDPSLAASGPVRVALPSPNPVLAGPTAIPPRRTRPCPWPPPGCWATTPGGSGALTTALVSPATSGRVTLRADGSFSYLPAADFVGTATFSYRAVRGTAASTPATVTITITEPMPSRCTITGTAGNDVLRGTARNDTICGLGGNDTIIGGDGDDLIFGGSGNDTLSGGDGVDTVNGGSGNDVLAGQDGRDVLSGVDGDDTLSGGDSDDLLIGGSGRDSVVGNDGNDFADGALGDSFDGGQAATPCPGTPATPPSGCRDAPAPGSSPSLRWRWV